MILLSHAIDDSNEYRHIANCADVCDLFTASRQTVKPFGTSFGSVDVGSTNGGVKSCEAAGGVGVLLVSDALILIQVGLWLKNNILLEERLLGEKYYLTPSGGLRYRRSMLISKEARRSRTRDTISSGWRSGMSRAGIFHPLICMLALATLSSKASIL